MVDMTNIYGYSAPSVLGGPTTFGGTDLANPGSAGGGLGDLFGNNPNLLGGLGGLAGGAAGAGLGYLLSGGTNLPYGSNLQGVAGQAGAFAGLTGAEGAALVDPLISGHLSAGAEALVQQQVQKEVATAKGRYASLGQTGSTMESDALTKIQDDTTAMRFKIAQQMAEEGLKAQQLSLSAMGLEGNIWSKLMQAQTAQDKNMSDTIGSFAKTIGSAVATIAPYAAMALL